MPGSSEKPACPACRGTDTTVERTHTVAAAAEHLVPETRDRDRNERLRSELAALFGSDHVDVRRCSGCGFWFASPYVSGTPEIYNLITEGHELYPAERFEFGLTIEALPRMNLDLLEIGGGDGAFLRKARSAGLTGRACATEYDDGSLASLASIPGVETFAMSPQELAAAAPGTFDAVCMFQVLEHMDRSDEVFTALRTLTKPDGQLFIGVPNDASVTWQEEQTGFWEMPPNHIGRWTRPAIESIASRHGFRVLDHRYEEAGNFAELWEMAKCRCQARAYSPETVSGRVNAMSVRAVRGPIKRALAAWDLVLLSPKYGQIPPRCQWFRLGAA
jgi:2-polyprenyl-3-methyl-5-hydroxy-6-metoxy-1,4-benzoquinol methylase